MLAQNYTYVIFETMPAGLLPPFFISTVIPSTPIRLRVEMKIHNCNVHALPEAQEHERQMRASGGDCWDRVLFPKQGQTPFVIPVDLWLPTSFTNGAREAPGVYAIVEWLSGQTAVVDIVCSDRTVPLDDGSRLERRFRSPSGRIDVVDIGTIARVLDGVAARE